MMYYATFRALTVLSFGHGRWELVAAVTTATAVRVGEIGGASDGGESCQGLQWVKGVMPVKGLQRLKLVKMVEGLRRVKGMRLVKGMKLVKGLNRVTMNWSYPELGSERSFILSMLPPGWALL